MSTLEKTSVATAVRRAVAEYFAAKSVPPAFTPDLNDPYELFHSAAANAIKDEIIGAGRKLWERQYVDGNGGNISARLSARYVLCTPTLCSKGDLRAQDFCLVDLENEMVCGDRPQTSEIRLHLQIYKTVPEAKAVIHCHPPYATAHAIAGVVPQGNLVPEQEVFVGPVALTPYETPGTWEFARTIIPVARQHNTILLANHGIVCWADTVSHAEWYVEVVDTYCKTVMIAQQLKSPLPEIPPEKIKDLLAFKKKLGLPDPRLPLDPEKVQSHPWEIEEAAVSGVVPHATSKAGLDLSPAETARLVAELTSKIVQSLEETA